MLLLLPSAGFARAGAPPPPPGTATTNGSDLEQRLAAVLDVPELGGASVGVFVRSLAPAGRVLFARNADLLLVPASNQKILTAAAALTRLGPDHIFVTRLGGVGARRDGSVWRGDLVLVGAGDPSLSSARLRDMALALKAIGVRRVTGRILADDTRFDDKRLGAGWQWDDEPFDYQPQVSALNLDENVVSVRIAPGRALGDPALVTLDPPTGYVRVVGTVRTAAKEAAGGVTFDRARGRNNLLVSGTIAVGAKPATAALTVEEPSLFAAVRLQELLKNEGIVVAGGPPVRAIAPPASVTPLAQSASAPLFVLVRDMMKRSDNLYAETLLKAAGAAGGTGPGTTARGARAVSALVAKAGAGDPAASLRLADGSGLSRLDLVTPRALAGLLAYLADTQRAGVNVSRAFGDALPVGGVDGTLRNRFKNTPAQNVVRAKTGSLSGVSALSGYVTTKAGEPLVFSILMNNVLAGTSAARRAQDAFVLVLMDAPAPAR